MKEVALHVYDVTNSGSETILQINRILRIVSDWEASSTAPSRLFTICIQSLCSWTGTHIYQLHQVYGDEEWSFGFCEQGSGVFSCPPSRNPMYTYRERIVLGETDCSIFDVNMMLRELSQEWPGQSYDLLAKNCNYFHDTFCERLSVPKLPGWVNRFANAGDTAVVVAGNAAFKFIFLILPHMKSHVSQ
ncbi:deSI-like protein At4g17486 [Zingiber officinale]|uniref:deSI-like protein At4g17486 n=1 Tax=Zingiber officinale TaxID=94328 RepID=UPI001C4D44AF|nr:deSI-like protein At4g17486 [Zingiber officinale]